eukprot:scaffold50398_cov17-Prasinocladus_malaysianus.AAC.1
MAFAFFDTQRLDLTLAIAGTCSLVSATRPELFLLGWLAGGASTSSVAVPRCRTSTSIVPTS